MVTCGKQKIIQKSSMARTGLFNKLACVLVQLAMVIPESVNLLTASIAFTFHHQP